MKKMEIRLENCYGIKHLEYEFDFSDESVYAIYAPNGSMKTSFAQSFKDISEGKESEDRMFCSRKTIREVTENGAELQKENVITLPPYDEFFGHSEKISTLLVNNKLREEYRDLHAGIDQIKKSFLKEMKEKSGLKELPESEIALAFTKNGDEESFYRALERISGELKDQKDAPFEDVLYDLIFDPKVLEILEKMEIKTAIKDYIVRYNQLLESSTYFKRGVFEYYNAAQPDCKRRSLPMVFLTRNIQSCLTRAIK